MNFCEGVVLYPLARYYYWKHAKQMKIKRHERDHSFSRREEA
jgi:hypothetical protein